MPSKKSRAKKRAEAKSQNKNNQQHRATSTNAEKTPIADLRKALMSIDVDITGAPSAAKASATAANAQSPSNEAKRNMALSTPTSSNFIHAALSANPGTAAQAANAAAKQMPSAVAATSPRPLDGGVKQAGERKHFVAKRNHAKSSSVKFPTTIPLSRTSTAQLDEVKRMAPVWAKVSALMASAFTNGASQLISTQSISQLSDILDPLAEQEQDLQEIVNQIIRNLYQYPATFYRNAINLLEDLSNNFDDLADAPFLEAYLLELYFLTGNKSKAMDMYNNIDDSDEVERVYNTYCGNSRPAETTSAATAEMHALEKAVNNINLGR